MREYFDLLRAIEGLHRRQDKFEAHINRRFNKMDSDLQAIIDSAHRSEGLTNSILTLVSGLTIALNNAADKTLDPATKATLKSLATGLDEESDKVVAALKSNPLPTTGDENTVKPPTISSISPTVVDALGGTSITITGTNLSGATAVTIGANPATSFDVVSDSEIDAIVPANTSTDIGASVTVTGADGSFSNSGSVTYSGPAPAPQEGGQDGAGA